MATTAPADTSLDRLARTVPELSEAARQLLAKLAERLLMEQRACTEGGLVVRGWLAAGVPRRWDFEVGAQGQAPRRRFP